MDAKRKLSRVAVGQNKGEPICIYDVATKDIVAYIPNGKTKISATEKECADCQAADRKLAVSIARLINDANAPSRPKPSCR